jgi:hypothetical protein
MLRSNHSTREGGCEGEALTHRVGAASARGRGPGVEVLAHVPCGVERAAGAAPAPAPAAAEAVRVLRPVGARIRVRVLVGEAWRAGAAGGEELGGARHGRPGGSPASGRTRLGARACGVVRARRTQTRILRSIDCLWCSARLIRVRALLILCCGSGWMDIGRKERRKVACCHAGQGTH